MDQRKDGGVKMSAIPTTIRPAKAFSATDILSWNVIGHSAPSNEDRHVGYGIKQTGWAGFIQNYIHAEYAWGIRRFGLHNPFGTSDTEKAGGVIHMQFDQYLHARAAKLDWLTDDFVWAWSAWIRSNPDTEVIAYIGSLSFDGHTDPDFERLQQFGEADDYLKRANDSLRPLFDCGMSIAFDTGGRYEKGSPGHAMIELCRSMGVRCYVEPVPFNSPSAAHLWDFPSMGIWDGNIPRDAVPHMTQEQIVFLLNPPTPPETFADATLRLAREALRRGLRPAIRVSDINADPNFHGVMRYKALAEFLE